MTEFSSQFKKLISHAKEYGFIFPSSEIYEGLSAVYDYGPRGVLLKNNLKDYWWKSMTRLEDNIIGLDSSILMHPTIWKASGHVDAFNDPLIDNRDSKKRYRADNLIEDYIEKLKNKITREVLKAKKRYGKSFNTEEYINTNSRVINYQSKINKISATLKNCLANEDYKGIYKLITELGIADPISGSKNWTDVRLFNMMFETQIGASYDNSFKVYLRPETAQGIFVNFSNVQKSSNSKLPFGIAQIGKAFRNEIVARQFIFRMREFEQMEMQFFVLPGEELEWFEQWKSKRMKWHLNIGLGDENYRFHNHLNLAHYANAATDIEFCFPFGFKELEGIHSRTDFDLKSHEQYSGKKLRFYNQKSGESVIPYVIETSIGLDRLFLAIYSHCLEDEKLEDGSMRTVFKVPMFLSPIKLAILPLVKKDGLPELAKSIYNELKLITDVTYDDKDAIGRRYRRQDAIGTPLALTVDYESLNNNSVTIRDRNTMQQERIQIEMLKNYIESKVSMQNALNNLI